MRRSPGGSVFLPFGFVLVHLQVFFNLRIRQRPMIGTARQKAKIQLPHRYIISVNALTYLAVCTLNVRTSTASMPAERMACRPRSVSS